VAAERPLGTIRANRSDPAEPLIDHRAHERRAPERAWESGTIIVPDQSEGYAAFRLIYLLAETLTPPTEDSV
jgi:hypothetical protein